MQKHRRRNLRASPCGNIRSHRPSCSNRAHWSDRIHRGARKTRQHERRGTIRTEPRSDHTDSRKQSVSWFPKGPIPSKYAMVEVGEDSEVAMAVMAAEAALAVMGAEVDVAATL